MAYRMARGVWGLGQINRLRMRGLGAADYTSYMQACTGGGGSASCNPMDQICIATANNVVDACNAQYVSDPQSPHNLVGGGATPAALVPGTAAYNTAVAKAGGSLQLVEQQSGEPVPPGTTPADWWGAPGAMIGSSCPPLPSCGANSSPIGTGTDANGCPTATCVALPSQPGTAQPAAAQTVMSSSSVPPNVAAQPPGVSYQPSQNQAPATSGFDLSSIPTWGWLAAAAAVGFLVFTQGR